MFYAIIQGLRITVMLLSLLLRVTILIGNIYRETRKRRDAEAPAPSTALCCRS